MERVTPASASYAEMHERVQQALKSVGTVERSIRDLGTDELAARTTRELNEAVTSLQEVRDWLSARMAG